MTQPPLYQALQQGLTSICRAWAITRRDGVRFGFTDHDRPLFFAGLEFRAESGLSAMNLSQTTGLSVDNTEALGVLWDDGVSEADIAAGKFDEAKVEAWLVNWANPEQIQLEFSGLIGEIQRKGGAFQAELRGLTALLNKPVARVYSASCSALLGDQACGFDLTTPGFVTSVALSRVTEQGALELFDLPAFDDGCFEHGTLKAVNGKARGYQGLVKRDQRLNANRLIELWEPPSLGFEEGDLLELTMGCDKRFETCRVKFDNALNFRGFPDIPSSDWLLINPAQHAASDHGSRR